MNIDDDVDIPILALTLVACLITFVAGLVIGLAVAG